MRKWSKHYENDTEQKGLRRNTELSYNADADGLESRLGPSTELQVTSPIIACQSLKFLVASICDLPDVINC